MELKDQLTTEKLKKRFHKENPDRPSNFDLVNFAISVAENMVLTDRECATRTEIKNRAYQALLEILSGKTKFVEVKPKEEGNLLQAQTRETIVNQARALQADKANKDAEEVATQGA